MLALVSAAYVGGALRPIEETLAQLRFGLLQRPASQTLTVVEIDVASIRAAGAWPWSRDRFASAINNLTAAGAEVVAFDVDFSARSTNSADDVLAAAINAHPGAVVLPTFIQSVGEPDARRLEGTNPLGVLSAQAVLASVNVPVDADGEVRRYQHSFTESHTERQSMAATLAGASPGRAGSFLIDYGVRVADIDRISFEAAYAGRFDPTIIRGRKILIGATALELGDEFVTPKGTLPGVYVHALAYESLYAGRALMSFQPVVLLSLSGLVAIFLRPRRMLDLQAVLRRHALVASGAVLAPLGLQWAFPISMDTSPVLMAQALCLVWATRSELKGRAQAMAEAREAHLVQLATQMRESRNRIRAANKRLQTSNAALDHALRAKTEFLAATSHEIRTPLNAILGMTQVILADTGLAGGLRDKVSAVQSAGETMQALVSDILDVAQMQTGELVVAPVEFDLQGLLADVAQRWAHSAASRGLVFRAQYDGAPPWIAEDPTRLRQILNTLLSNATKFTEQGEVVLSVRTEGKPGDEQLVLEVCDTGVGIPADQLERIFEAFTQVDDGLARRYGGAGLGLAICRQLSRAMGGDVTVRSKLSSGAVFTVRLPLRRVERRREAPEPTLDSKGDVLERAAVLLLDANPLYQRVIKAALVDHVGSIDVAKSTVEAAEAFATRQFDLLVADGQTLGGDIASARAQLVALVAGASQARVSVLWGGAPEAARDLLLAGADHVALKPISAADLVTALQALCAAPSGPRQGLEITPMAASG